MLGRPSWDSKMDHGGTGKLMTLGPLIPYDYYSHFAGEEMESQSL